jgi:tetratricopeptide (TPR) repeat protein
LYFKRGVCLGELGNQKNAIKDFKKSIELNYRISDSYFNMSLDYNILLDDSAALACVKKCLIINPNDTLAQVLYKSIILIQKNKKRQIDAHI